MTAIPLRTIDSKTIVGNNLVGVRQRVIRTGQFNGVAPVVTGPPQIDPLDGAMFASDLYMYADVQPECLVGNLADVNGQVLFKAIDQTVDAKLVTISLIPGTALSVDIVGRLIVITFVNGVTTYAALLVALAAHPDLPTYFDMALPGTGASNVIAQDALTFVEPPLVQAVQNDGGIFMFTPGPRAISLHSISLVCGAGSIVDAFIRDKGGANPRQILTGVAGAANDHTVDIPLLSSEEIMIQETVSGVPGVGIDKYVTLYLVKDQVL
ncbi:MAG: hypothetical protein DRP83_00050 [Planctomycetota bacterium]|nr:MAG: hypothetical protein DRP83_00050 [Planctomycetota bacterium]